MPPPSSATTITTSAPSRVRLTEMRPTSGLPSAARRSGASMPCTTALRSMCSSGGTMRSSICRSSSAEAPCTTSSARLPVSFAACRTRRVSRCTCRWNGTMRVRIRLFCSSVMMRACWVSRFCASRVSVSSKSLDARDVARGLGERARVLLQRRIAVELERIEVVAARILLVLMPVEHLRFGLDLEAAQLLLESRHRARQLRQIEVDGVDLLIEARAEDAHLAGVVQHGVEQIRIDARHLHPLRRHALAARQHGSAAHLELRQRVLGHRCGVDSSVIAGRGRRCADAARAAIGVAGDGIGATGCAGAACGGGRAVAGCVAGCAGAGRAAGAGVTAAGAGLAATPPLKSRICASSAVGAAAATRPCSPGRACARARRGSPA